jgi:hypothetical protein
LEDSKAALLVIIGALTDGRKVLLAIEAGQRESKESWARVLRDLFARGLQPWRVTVADGHLGIWSALGELCPAGEERRRLTWGSIPANRREPEMERGGSPGCWSQFRGFLAPFPGI